jgi:hypothetical protein
MSKDDYATGDSDPSVGGRARAAASACPSREQLIAYTLGKLPEETLQVVADHLETCGGCLAALSTVAEAEDSLLSGLRRPPMGLRPAGAPPDGQQFLNEPQCQEAVRQFEAVGSEPLLAARTDHVADLKVPRKLGRYELLEELGRGGMGTVYLAADAQLDRQVALKIPHFRAGDNPDVLERFYREARAAAKIRHASLCPVYDVGEIDGLPYLSMAYIPGRSLARLLQDHVPLSQREAAEIVRKLALGVQEAHAHGVVHRDIKPSNVIVAQSGEPILTDFGLARTLEADLSKLTHCGVMVGTPAYMAPEQVDGDAEAVGPCSDVYGLGVLLYELLTGEVPFRGPLLSVVSQIGRNQPQPPSLRCVGLDPQLEAVCLKAMAKDRADRYQSAGELAAALERYSHGLPEAPAARPRHRRLIWVGAGAVVAALFSLAVLLSSLRRGEGVLVLEVNEPGVTVAVDGQEVQLESPDEGITLPAGQHWLEVTKDGFYSHRQSLAVGRGEKVVLVATLRKRVAVGRGAAGNLVQVLLNPTGDDSDRFGTALAAVGENVLVGAPQDDTDARNGGIAYLFSGATGQLLRVLRNPQPADDDHFGEVVAAMGEDILIAAPQPFSSGPGFVFLFDGLTGRFLHRFQHPTPHPRDGFGSSLATLGNKVFIGAHQDDTVATDAGAVYVFELDAGQWKLRPRFLGHVPRANDYFGGALALAGGNLLVGAVGEDQHGTDAGAVYLFNASTGGKLRTFWNPSPVAGDVFGHSIAAVNDPGSEGHRSRALVAVGAHLDDTGAESAGVVYLFAAESGELVQTLLNPTPAIDEHFGWSLAALGDRVLVGAYQDDTGAENTGAAYLFSAASGKLVQQFFNPSPAAHDHFGYCVAALANNVLIGTRRAGAVYLFAGPAADRHRQPAAVEQEP